MTPRLPVRLAALLVVAALTAVLSAPAGAHIAGVPEQHETQLLPANDLGALPKRNVALPGAKCENGTAGIYPCKNVDMASSFALPTLGPGTGNDIWGWTHEESGREFAIMGLATATAFVEVTNPEDPVYLGTLPTRGADAWVLWRDIKVANDHAYIVSELGGSGLQVFDLTKLLDAPPGPAVFEHDATYDEFSYAHNISINEETNRAYVVGSNTCGNDEENGGLHIVDISAPTEPRFLGCAVVEDLDDGDDIETNNYAHDVECVVYNGPDADYAGREICFGSNENAVVIYDVTNAASPEVINIRKYPTAEYTHQGALTADQQYFLFGDELDEQGGTVPNTATYVLDVRDLDAPPEPKIHLHASKTIDHNMYVSGNRVFQSNYMEGLRILEFDDASLAEGRLNEVAYFDVLPGADVAEFAGTWSNYRFPNSGTVVVSTIENAVNGMFVLRPTLDAQDGGDATQPGKRRAVGKPDHAGPKKR